MLGTKHRQGPGQVHLLPCLKDSPALRMSSQLAYQTHTVALNEQYTIQSKIVEYIIPGKIFNEQREIDSPGFFFIPFTIYKSATNYHLTFPL